MEQSKGPSAATIAANRAARSTMPQEDTSDYEDARRGLIAQYDPPALDSLDGSRKIWDSRVYNFLLSDNIPDSVHPSLWRQARLNLEHGLFELAPGLYQVRGYDLSNMTIVEGQTGVIVIDTLVSVETAAAALRLYRQNRGERPVRAVIYTHSHSDHFAGIRGVLEDDALNSTPIIAPEHFLREAISENLFAGHAMQRRALYFSGAMLPKGPLGQVDAGLGKSVSTGTVSFIAPNDHIKETGEIRVLDGIEFIFQMAPETEAPAEMLIFIPAFSALCTAEIATPTMHNIYTPRGAQVRNAINWWKAIDYAIAQFGDKTDILFAQHHWPRWGRNRIIDFLEKQRDLYKYMHDQTLRLLNKGFNAPEIAERIVLPVELSSVWHCREYYGTLRHNAKGLYQRYLGWYDGHPANLNPLAPDSAAQRYVEFMGGVDAVVEKCRSSFDKGDYRWVAEVLKHVVINEPEHQAARSLQADALEQLGYQSESAVWRNMYLSGAHELRQGLMTWSARKAGNADQIREMSTEMLFDYLGIRLNPERASGRRIRIGVELSEHESHTLLVSNGTLTYRAGKAASGVDVRLCLTREQLNLLVLGQGDTAFLHSCVTAGETSVLNEFVGMLDTFDGVFPIVSSRP